MNGSLSQPAPGSALGSFLLPDGFRRPPVVAVLREGRIGPEVARAVVHAAGSRRASRGTPYAGGDRPRHTDPVLLVPGFLAGDGTLSVMHRRLRGEGYRTYRSHIRANIGCTLAQALTLESRIERIVERRGSRVQIVGHSLGGMLARGIAARRPDLVSGIVTMGSPMRAPGAHHLALTLGVGVLVGLSRSGVPGLMTEDCVAGGCARQSFDESQMALAEHVGFTAIYSRRDGIVDWRACIDPAAHAVEVRASHVGMAVDPRVVREVLSGLARNRVRASAAGSVLEVDRGVGA